MNAIMVVNNFAFSVEHEKVDNSGENLMYAMFSFDTLQAHIPYQLVEQYPSREEWLIFLLNQLAAFYGVDQADILREWAEYNALPGSATYYRLQELLRSADK